jgi:hypothetical protein
MQMRAVIGCSFALIALFSFGCATKSFKVDAIAVNAPLSGRTYHILPANPQVPDNDLRFMEAAGIMENALAMRGYTRARDSASANLLIALEAFVGQPENVAIPRPDASVDPDFGFYHMARIPFRSRFGGMCYMRTMVWGPDYDFADRSDVRMATIYEKRLIVTAFSNNGSHDLPQVWSVVVIERDESSDLRSLLPMMAVAAVRYAETDTKGQVTSYVKAKDPEVIRVSPVKPDAK